MYPNHQAAAWQRQLVQCHAADTDSYSFFNLLTGPQLLDGVEAISLPTTLISHLTMRFDSECEITATLYSNPNCFWARESHLPFD